MKRWRKILICLLSAVYLVTSFSGNPVYAREEIESVVTQDAVGTKAGSTLDPNPQHGQHVEDGNNEMNVTMIDQDVVWKQVGSREDAVRIATNSAINADSTAMLVQYKIQINLDEAEYVNYQEDGVCITIPRTIFRSYNSYTSQNPSLNLDDGIGVYKIANLFSPSSGFKYVQDGDKIKITNRGVLQSRSIEITLSYKPAKTSYFYPDYDPQHPDDCGSLPFDVDLNLVSSTGKTANLQAQAPRVFIDTSAEISEVTKTLDGSWKGVETDTDDKERTYLYVRFKVYATVKSEGYKYPTQAYTWNMTDDFNGYGDIHYNDGATDFSWTFVGWSMSASSKPADYKTESYHSSSSPTTNSTITRYCLFKILRPESLYVDYILNNTATTSIEPRWKIDDITSDDGSDKYEDKYHNTNPKGMYFVHNWSNTNWESDAHKRNTQQHGYQDYHSHPWKNANREIDRFANQQNDIFGNPITELKGLRYYTWYYGYPSLYYTSPNRVKFVCENKDIEYYKERHNLSSPTQALGTDKYCLRDMGFYLEATYAVYDSEDGYWMEKPNVDPYENDHETVYVYGLIGGRTSNDWKLMLTVDYNLSTKRWDIIDIKQDGQQHIESASYTLFEGEDQDHAGSDRGVFIKFSSSDVYGYRIENVNKHFYFFVGVRANYSIKSTEDTRKFCGSESKAYYAFIYDFADMDIYNWNFPPQNTDSVVSIKDNTVNAERDADPAPGELVFRFSNTDSKPDRVAGAVAAGENNRLLAEKTLVESERDGTLNRYRARWKLEGWHFFYGGTSRTGQYYPVQLEVPMEGGIFYDVLPKGAVLEDMDNPKNCIKVYKNPLWTNYYVEDSQAGWDAKYLKKDAADAAVIDNLFLMDPEDYEVELYTDYFNEEPLNGFVVLVVKINKRSEGWHGALTAGGTTHYLSGGYTVVFDTYTPYSLLAEGNKRIVNAMCFESLNGHEYKELAYADNPNSPIRPEDGNPLKPLQNTSFADYNKVLKLLTDVDKTTQEYIFSYDYAETTASYDSIAQAGPSKLVAGEDGEMVMDLEVEPGGTYTYYLRYATNLNSSADNLVFLDKIETYSDSEVGPSQWHGTLVGLGAETNTGVEIPAKYYISEKDDADQHAFTDTTVWEEVTNSTDLSKAVWVAADLGEYVVKPLDIVFVKLTMVAPTSNETDYLKPETYNNYRITGRLKDISGGQYSGINNVTNYTVVKYTIKGKIQIEKVNEAGEPIQNVRFVLTGTSKFGDTVNVTVRTDAEGKAVIDNLDITGTEGYTLTETVPAGYVVDKTTWNVTIDTDGSSKVDGEDATTVYYRIVNKAATEISATKKWINADGTTTPPENGKITFTLYADGNPTEYTVELVGEIDPNRPAGTGGYEVKEWVALFINLPKYDDAGNEIEYTVMETGQYDGYEPTSTEAVEDGGIIYNKEIVTTVSVVKVWDDNNDQDGVRPDSITFTLYANGVKVSSIVLDGEADDNGEEEAWKATWKGLPKRANGADIVYTVKEEETEGLLADYEVIYPDHDERYAVDGEKIINRHETDETTVSVLKTWDDDDDRDGVRPDSITFTLYADGKKVGSIVLDGEPDDDGEKEAWKATWEKLPKKNNGKEIKYTVKEEETDELLVNYTVIYPDHEEASDDVYALDGETITNRHITEETEVSVIKTWDDKDDQDGVRPESVEFTLYANGKEIGSITLDGTVDENGEKEAWKATWEKLPVNEAGKPIKYTVKETSSDVNYTVIYPDHEEEYAVDGEEIINRHITEETEVSVIKTWDDKDDQDGIRPDSVTFTLYADGKKVSSIVLDGTADENGEKEAWKATWEKLPKKAGGKDIVYTVKEEDLGVAGYTVIYPDHEEEYAVDGEEIINRHITEETEVSVIKTWDDKDDQDGVRPASVEFTLYANGKEVGSIVLDGKADEDGEKEAWKATWEKLPVNEAGKPIKYTVKETSSDVNYTVIYPDHEEEYAVDGEAITNKHVPGTVGVSAKKVWDDKDDQDGIRPASVEFTLYADGTKVSSIVLDGKVDTTGEFEAWVASWKELPEKKDGVTIEYTVKETSTAVDYEVIYEDGKAYAVDGGTITNKHVPETIILHIEKVWKDDDDRQGKRPATITVNLLADDVVFDTIVIKSDLNGDWHYDSEELPKYKDGKEIKYSITEETVPDYMTDITGSAADGFIITNTVGVDTADRTHLPLWICLMLLSNTSAVATALYFKKKEEE